LKDGTLAFAKLEYDITLKSGEKWSSTGNAFLHWVGDRVTHYEITADFSALTHALTSGKLPKRDEL
jgi:hypothetical protein